MIANSGRVVRWLVVGVGDITRKRVIPAILADPRSRLCALLTRDGAKASPWPEARVWTSLEDAAADQEIDAVYVASPVFLHAWQTMTFLRAGRHVLCEKPVAMDYDQARAMEACASQTACLSGVAYFRRLFPKLIRAKELMAAGAIGQPVLGQANCHGWLESEERAWLRDPAVAGGGPLFDIGSHRIDAVNFLFGNPTRATGLRSRAVHRFGVEDSATALVGYESGAHALIDVRWTSRVPRDEFRIIGTQGELDLTPLYGPELRTPEGMEHLPCSANVHLPLVANFTAAVLDGSELACPLEEAIRTDWVTSQICAGAGRLGPAV